MSYNLKTKPWKHQWQALDYMMIRDQAALYTDMGSGKTKVALDLIVNRGFKKSIIVTTRKGCAVWEDEIDTHIDTSSILICNLSEYSTKEKSPILKGTLGEAKRKGFSIIFIINYDSIWRDPFKEDLLKTNLDCIICDESHRIKSPNSKCSMFLTRLGKRVQHRYLMTGTPSTGNPIDVYAQYRFLDPTIFGTNFTKFRNQYENVDPIRSAYGGYRALDKKEPYKNLDELKEKMYSCAFHVTPDIKLPPVTDITVTFKPSKAAMDIYHNIERFGIFEEKDGILDTNNALVKILRMQQVLSGCLVLENEDYTEKVQKPIDYLRSVKLEELLEGIPESEKVVVFAKFRYDFDKIKEVCERLGISYGEISGKQDDYKAWQKGKIRLVAVHYQSGSESISLTEARYVIYYSLSHSYGMYAQSRKRVHRPKQERPVTYYHIVATIPNKVSLDEEIMNALEFKKDIVDYLLEKNNGKR